MTAAPTRALFVAAHLAAALLVALVVVLPLASRFVDRHAALADEAEELRRLRLIGDRAHALAGRMTGAEHPFLSDADPGVGGADLQAMLEAATRSGGARLIAVHGLQAPKLRGIRAVAARLDVEGPTASVAATLKAIEDQVPLLWVTGASLRRGGDGEAGADAVHAEFQVAAALRPADVPAEPAAAGVGTAP